MRDIIAPLLGGGGIVSLLWAVVALVKTISNRKIVAADAAEQLSAQSIAIIQAVRADAEKAIAQARAAAADAMSSAAADVASSRRDADEARRDAAEARREATAARKEAMEATATMRRLTTEILSPYATLERLRALVGDGQAERNGRPA